MVLFLLSALIVYLLIKNYYIDYANENDDSIELSNSQKALAHSVRKINGEQVEPNAKNENEEDEDEDDEEAADGDQEKVEKKTEKQVVVIPIVKSNQNDPDPGRFL